MALQGRLDQIEVGPYAAYHRHKICHCDNTKVQPRSRIEKVEMVLTRSASETRQNIGCWRARASRARASP